MGSSGRKRSRQQSQREGEQGQVRNIRYSIFYSAMDEMKHTRSCTLRGDFNIVLKVLLHHTETWCVLGGFHVWLLVLWLLVIYLSTHQLVLSLSGMCCYC